MELKQTQRLRLFYCKAKGGYVGGMCIVAANSALEAYGLVCAHYEIVRDFYHLEDFTEIENAVHECAAPYVIAECSHEG